MGKKLFSYVIGNPPYQDETLGDNKGFAPPVYNFFMEASYMIANKVELIHPARFLFNAGSTPKAWNKKMLSDKHFKVLEYFPDASTVFPNTDIKGGVTITYRDETSNCGMIEIFIPIKEMNAIFHKVYSDKNFIGVDTIAVSGYSYHFTETLYEEHPELVGVQSAGHDYDLKSNIFDKMATVFFDNCPDDEKTYSLVLGRENNSRKYKYIDRRYLNDVVNFNKHKILLPKAIGIGEFGETITDPIVATPNTGHTETFFSIGCFDSSIEAENLKKYLSTKFSRALLSILKKTQNVTPGNFAYVPLQDFTEKSDIDWSKSVADIDRQLYKKYGLTQEEIDFIETHVKEMA